MDHRDAGTDPERWRSNTKKKREERCEGPCFFCVFVCFLLYLGLLHKGYEVCSETAGLASHVPASKTKELMLRLLRVVKQLR